MAPSAYVLGGNSSSLAFVCGVAENEKTVDVWLVPIAWTPAGVITGEQLQRVGVTVERIAEWADQTFAPEDERAFVAPLRDLELLMRSGWKAAPPERLDDESVLNPHDLPEDVLDGLHAPPVALVQCPVCRRTCARDDFVWNERRLCAWDYHTAVLGKRGPWRSAPYEPRLFETLPAAAYVVPELLDELKVDAVLHTIVLDDATAHALINSVIAAGGEGGAYLAVRTQTGYSLLRERP